MLILDCWIPTRFEIKWTLRPDDKGNMEIMARGERVPTFKGRAVEGHKSDFTDNMIKYCKKFVNEINVPRSRGGYGSNRAPMSLPQLMATNKLLCSNPKRIFDRKTRARDETPVARFCMLPSDVRASGRISFRMKTIQEAKPDENEDEDDSGSLFVQPHEDEGFDEGSSEQKT